MENMEDTPRPGMAKTAITYGLLIGVLLIVIQLVFYFAGIMTSMYSAWISYAVILGGILLATKAYRDEVRGGFISYGQALGFGTLTIFFASILVGIYIFLFYKLIDPGAMNLLYEAAEQKMIDANPNITDEELDMALSISQRLMKPGFMTISTIFNYTFIGFVLSLITSIFMKKNNPEEL
ncbi:MAG: DUF4199 domain-containing protein [Bacteroidales bacterium]|nr:DUF4199 domain-containing protein [Bacteroidales bacterium]